MNPSPENKVAETPLLKVFNLEQTQFVSPQTGGDGFRFYTRDTGFSNGRVCIHNQGTIWGIVIF
jgi:hypothetical protein